MARLRSKFNLSILLHCTQIFLSKLEHNRIRRFLQVIKTYGLWKRWIMQIQSLILMQEEQQEHLCLKANKDALQHLAVNPVLHSLCFSPIVLRYE